MFGFQAGVIRWFDVYLRGRSQRELPEYMNELVSYNGDFHRYPTSTRNDFRIAKKNSERTKNFLFDKGLKIFNELSKEVKCESSENRFKSKLKEHLKATIKL